MFTITSFHTFLLSCTQTSLLQTYLNWQCLPRCLMSASPSGSLFIRFLSSFLLLFSLFVPPFLGPMQSWGGLGMLGCGLMWWSFSCALDQSFVQVILPVFFSFPFCFSPFHLPPPSSHLFPYPFPCSCGVRAVLVGWKAGLRVQLCKAGGCHGYSNLFNSCCLFSP